MSGLLGGKKTQSTTPQRLNSIQVNQSAYGNAVTLLYGTSKLPITLNDYVDFKSIAQTQSSGGKGGGSSTTNGFQYSASIVAAICEGPAKGVRLIYKDKEVTTLDALKMVQFLGTAAQAPWQYMQSNHPERALPYDHTAYIAAPNFDLGSSAGIPNLSIEMIGLLPYNDTIIDAEPSAIITDYCTDPHHGIGFPYLASLTGTNSYQQYCIAMGFFISPCETTQRAGQDFIREILQLTNAQAVWTAGVGLRIVPYQDQPIVGNSASYTPNLTPVYTFTDADYLYEQGQEPVTRSIIPANETFNTWRVEYLDRNHQYNTAIEEFRDELDIAQNGVRVASTVNLHSITLQPVAKTVAALLGLRNLNIRSTFTFKVRADFSLLEPMDLVAINDSTAGIVNQLVRIIETNDDENDEFTITAEEMMVGPASAPQYDTQLLAGYAANYGAAPGPVATPYIFTLPPLLADPSTGGYEIGIAVAGSTGLWGGCDVWASLDNVSYDHVGMIVGPARVGASLGALPAGQDPDTANILSVQLNSNYPMVINSGTRSDADNLRTLFILDGEVMSYQTSQALGNNAFSLSYLRRNQYQSTNAAHPAGSQFAIIDKAIFRMPFDPGDSGQPVWFKFTSFNIYGAGNETLASVSAYQAFFQAQNGGQLLSAGATPLVARGNCVNVGSRIFKSGGASAWDSDCYSVDAFASGCTMKFRSCQTSAWIIAGLDSNPTIDQNYASIDFGWEVRPDGRANIYESGIFIQDCGPYTTNSILEIRYDGRFIRYYLSGVLFREIPAPGRVFFLDSSFYSPGAAIDNVYFGALNPATSSPFVARGSCKVSDENAQKVGGVLAWDSDVYSIEGYPTAHVTWKANQANADFIIGLGINPGSDSSYSSIDFGMQCASNGNLYAQEKLAATLIGTYDNTSRLAVTYDGTTVVYSSNGVVLRTVTVASKGMAIGTPLFMDSSFYTIAAGCNTLQFGPTTQLELIESVQLNQNAATTVASVSVNGPVNIYSAGVVVTLVGTVSVGAFSTASTQVITVIGSVDHNFPSAQCSSCITVSDFALSSFAATADTWICRNPSTGEPLAGGSWAKEFTYAVPASTAKTYYVYGLATVGSSVSGAFSNLYNTQIKVEAIKR